MPFGVFGRVIFLIAFDFHPGVHDVHVVRPVFDAGKHIKLLDRGDRVVDEHQIESPEPCALQRERNAAREEYHNGPWDSHRDQVLRSGKIISR